MKNQPVTVEISSSSIIKILVIILGLLFLYFIKEVLAIVFISLIFAAAITPFVDKMQKHGIPRGFGVLILYLILFGVVTLMIALLIPPVIEQLKQLSANFPSYYEQIVRSLQNFQEFSASKGLTGNVEQGLQSITSTLTKFTGSLFGIVGGIFGSIFTILGVLVMTFYLALEETSLKKLLQSIAPAKYQPYFIQKTHQIQEKLGLWLRGQLILSVVIGFLSYIGLVILGVHYSLVLALVAGITEFVPYIGPIIGAIPAIFLASAQSPTKAVLVMILYVIIQQLENQILVPKVMQKTVGLNPIIVLIVTLTGATVGGVIGIMLAVPTATILSIFFEDFFAKKEEENLSIEKEE